MIGYIWNANWFTSAIISFFAWINAGIYGLVSIVCSLIVNISNTTFNDSLLGNFQTRIYIVLAIYMLFKLAFSLLSSIVNPDQLLDKEKGMQKIIPRTIVALIMLIMFPTIFEYAMKWQNDIVEFIPRIIIGRKVTLDEEGIGGEGAKIAATALSAFITPNEQCQDFSEEDIASVDSYIDTSSFGNVVDATIQRCDATKSEFKYEFSGLVSLIVGIILIFILATYCIDIGIRVLKLGILKILSPIPIISYIDPKSQKSGAFGNWLKECVSTYVELFIKMGILHFTLFILGNLSDSSTSLFKYPENATISRPFIMLVLIISSFFFMGKAAQFICNILGIKYDKGSGGVLGKALGIAGGALLGAGVGAAGAVIAGGGLAGAASAALNGITTGANGKPLGSFNKGREIAANIQGKEKPTSMIQKAQSSIMRKQAAKMGITDESLDNAKAARDVASSRFDLAESLLQQAPDGAMIEWGDKKYSKEKFAELVYNGKDSLKAEMLKRKSTYDEMKAQGAKWHVGKAVETYSDKYRAARNKGDLSDYTPDVSAYMAPENRRIVMPEPIVSSQPEPSIDVVSPIYQTPAENATNVVPEMVSNMMNRIENPRPNNSASQTANAGSDMVSNMTRHIQNTNNNGNNDGNNSNK